MIPPRLRKLPRLVAVDPRLEQVMPTAYRELACFPWQVVPFRPGEGGPADDRPRVVVDSGRLETPAWLRELRPARPMAPIYVVAASRQASVRQLPLLATLGADDFFLTGESEELRLLDLLERGAAVQQLTMDRVGDAYPARAADGAREVLAREQRSRSRRDREWALEAMLRMLMRDIVPPWHVSDLYRRAGLNERRAQRCARAAGISLSELHRQRVLLVTSALRHAGLTWVEVAALQGAPSPEALRNRTARATWYRSGR